jgi:transposase
MPPAQQNRVLTRQELLNSLPPQRQNQVRRSVQQYLNMPEERKAVVNQEIQRMAPMSDEDRRAHMNGEEFRNRYSANEQQMMGNLMEIQPQR